jgi:hypothetical protein
MEPPNPRKFACYQRTRDGTGPCVTPACISLGTDVMPSTETVNFLFERHELISFTELVEISSFDCLYSKLWCHVVSRAFSISKNTAAVDMLLEFSVTWSASLIH